VPLSTWVRAAHAFSYETKEAHFSATGLADLPAEIGVSYRTVPRMRDIIKRAAEGYKGYRLDFGALPFSFMRNHASEAQYTIKSTGVLAAHAQSTKGSLRRTECLLGLLLATSTRTRRKRTKGRSSDIFRHIRLISLNILPYG